MKINLSELQPNPYRDLARYPIHREKVEALKASIRSTGFWENVLVRKNDAGNYELAYGHHRLFALKELIDERVIEADFQVDSPVRKLDDATMIRIMANENMDEYKVTSDIVDETVRVTREYIHTQTQTPLGEITASDISQFLSGCWHEDKVSTSLTRLSLFDRGTLQREQLKGLSLTAAKAVQREVAKVEKTSLKSRMGQLEDEEEEVTEQERRKVRSQVQKAAHHVAQVLADHIREGGSMNDFKEKSIIAQAQMIPEEAPPEDKRLSTIDAAAKSLNAREFQRKTAMLLKYQAYMSAESKQELSNKLRDLASWCQESCARLEE
jgi:hypothetical protein